MHFAIELSAVTYYAAATWKSYHTRSELFNVIVSRTTLHQIKIIKPNYCPPGQVPTRTTPRQDHYQPVKPLMRTNTYTVGNCPGRELSGYGSELFNVIGSRTTPHWMKIKPKYCPPGSWSIGPLPTKTNKTTHQDRPIPIQRGIVLVGSCPDMDQNYSMLSVLGQLPTR